MKTIDQYLCHFGKNLEWLSEGIHFRKIYIHCVNNAAEISLNIWVKTFTIHIM